MILEVDAILRGLKSTGLEPDNWGAIFHHIVANKLDEETRNDWQKTRTDNDNYPQYSELQKYLIGLAHVTDVSLVKPKQSTQSYNPVSLKEKSTSPKRVFSTTSTKACYCCKKSPHLLIQCDEFKTLNPSKRYDIVKSAKLCLNCFNSKHQVNECDRLPCKVCKHKHHSLRH